jgi:DNA mismatch endonuclease (patch repair protein)
MELELRSALHRRGMRFRVQMATLEGYRRRADIVFIRERVAIFVDGCFWHGCPLHRTFPKRNAEWWSAKLSENMRRDEDTNLRLSEAGWLVLRFWEHEDVSVVAKEIERMVRERRAN